MNETKINILYEKDQNFTQNRRAELKKQSTRIAEVIVAEAGRIVESRRLPDTNSEVTLSNCEGKIVSKQMARVS